MFVATKENLRIRLGPELKEALDAFQAKKKLSQQDTVKSLLEWFLRQEGMVQSLIVGHVDEEYRGQVAELVLERMKQPKHRGRYIGPKTREPDGASDVSERQPART